MEITWEVADGYVGKSRPQHTIINDEDLSECETVIEAMQIISDSIQEDFDNKITWCFRNHSNNISEIQSIINNKGE